MGNGQSQEGLLLHTLLPVGLQLALAMSLYMLTSGAKASFCDAYTSKLYQLASDLPDHYPWCILQLQRMKALSTHHLDWLSVPAHRMLHAAVIQVSSMCVQFSSYPKFLKREAKSLGEANPRELPMVPWVCSSFSWAACASNGRLASKSPLL